MPGMLVLRLSAIGDVAMSVHAVKELRKEYPDLPLTIGTRERLAPLYSSVPGLDFIFLEEKAGFAQLRAFIRKAADKDFEYVADIQNNLRTNIIRRALRWKGCKVRAFDNKAFAKWRVKRRFHKKILPVRNNVLRFCDVFASLGFPVGEPPVERTVLPVPEGFPAREGVWVGVAPFSRKAKKIYPLDKMSRLVEILCGKYDKVFLFSGPGAELEYCRSLAERFPNAETVFSRTDMAGETALISNLDALVTMDSATMHFASLTGAPFVAVWGGTHPATGYSAWGADPATEYVILGLPCQPCSNYGEGKCRFGQFRCLEIPPETIAGKVASLVGRGRRS